MPYIVRFLAGPPLTPSPNPARGNGLDSHSPTNSTCSLATLAHRDAFPLMLQEASAG